MNTKLTKIVSVALTATTAVWMSGALLLVPAASAQSTADLQAQIAALLAQIQQLQGKLGQPSSGSAITTNFATDLTVGSKGSDVNALQQILINKGYLKVAAPTGYFGALTKAAVAAWQAASGISPAVGYFGPKSRAVMNSMAVAPSPSPLPSPSPAPSGSPTPAPNAPASGLVVSVANDNPAAGSLISSPSSAAARVPVLAVSFTAGTSGPVTVTELKFHKTGVISDSAISGAYLVQAGKVVAQYNSISAGVLDFAGLNWTVPAGQTAELWLAIDPATNLSAGNTTGFALSSNSDITSVDASGNAITETGNFPIMGSVFTVTSVSNPAIASLTVASTSIASTVTAGTTNNIVGAWNMSAVNSKVWLKGVNFRMIGSANKGDLKNLKLFVNGVQAGNTLASVSQDGTAYFDLSANPGTINTGSNNVQLFADVMGSPSYNFQFEILNSYDVYAVDSQYNVPVVAASNVGTLVTIQSGTVTVSQSSNTPTGNLAPGQSNITLAKFTVYAAGEAVKVKFLDFKIQLGSSTVTSSASLQNQLKNIAITDDAGGQIGTTINSPVSGAACQQAAGSAIAAGVYTDCFGTPNSNVNYIIPANTTRVLSLKADIQSGASFVTAIGSLVADTGNLQGLTSSATGNTGSAQGASLSLASTQLTVAQNTSLGNQNVSKNSANVRVGSYALTASSADGVTISTLTITSGNTSGVDLQNLKVMVGGVQFGVTQGLVSSNQAYSFSGTPFTIPVGGTTYVDVYADILGGATGSAGSFETKLSGLSGTGVTSYNAVGLSTAVNGQGLTVAGNPAITVALDSASPSANQLVMGSTGNSLAAFRFTETSNVENVKITDLNVFDNVGSTSTVKSGFGNLSLYNGSTLVGSAGSAVPSLNATSGVSNGAGYIYSFHFATPVVVPQANSITLVLKGDVSSYSSSGATDNTTHVFKIATSTDSNNNTQNLAVVALGNSSNAPATTTLSSVTGNAQTLLRSKLTVTGTPLGVTSGRAKTAVDDLATLNFAADAAGSVQLNTVTLTFSGSAPSGTQFFVTGTASPLQIYDPSTGNSYFPVAVSGQTATFNMATVSNVLGSPYTVSAGTTKSFNVRINSTSPATALAANGVSQTLSVTVAAATNVTWADGLDLSATGGLNLPTVVIPVQLQSVSYSAGS